VEDLFVSLFVVDGDGVDVDLFATALLDELEAVVDDVRVVRPRKSILSRPIFSTDFMS